MWKVIGMLYRYVAFRPWYSGACTASGFNTGFLIMWLSGISVANYTLRTQNVLTKMWRGYKLVSKLGMRNLVLWQGARR